PERYIGKVKRQGGAMLRLSPLGRVGRLKKFGAARGRPGRESIFVRQKQGRLRTIGLGDYPELHAGFREPVRRQEAKAFGERKRVPPPVVLRDLAPVAGHMALKQGFASRSVIAQRAKRAGRGHDLAEIEESLGHDGLP